MSNPSIKQLGSDIIITPNVDNMQTRAINLPSVDPVPVKVFFFSVCTTKAPLCRTQPLLQLWVVDIF